MRLPFYCLTVKTCGSQETSSKHESQEVEGVTDGEEDKGEEEI